MAGRGVKQVIALGVVYYLLFINTVAVVFGLYGYGMAKGWWK